MPDEGKDAKPAAPHGSLQGKRSFEEEDDELSGPTIKKARMVEEVSTTSQIAPREPESKPAQVSDQAEDTPHGSLTPRHPPEEQETSSHLLQVIGNSNSKLTTDNIVRHTRETESRRSSSDDEPAISQWGFTKMKRPSKSDVETKRTPTESSLTGDTATTKSISTTDARFPKVVQKNGVLDKEDSLEPSNITDIRRALKRPRESPSPTLEQFKEFNWEVQVSETERDIELVTLPLLKKYKDRDHKRVNNQQFTDFPRNIGFNDGLSAPKPDFIEGFLERSFEPYPVKDRLGGSAVPTPNKYPIALAHIAGEFKKRGGDLECGSQQAAYDAACLVYARDNANISIGKFTEASAAHVGSFVTDGDRLAVSVHYAVKNSSGRTVYHQCPIFDSSIRTDHESFKTGYRYLRNLQDWARDNARSTKDGLIDHYHQQAEATEKDRKCPTPESMESHQQLAKHHESLKPAPTNEVVL